MKRLILATGLFTAMASMCLQAQTMNLQASIPFDFRIGSTVFPSGEYSIDNSPSGLLLMRRREGKHESGMFMTVGESRPAVSTHKGALLFNRYGDAYFLSRVWSPESQTARAPVMTSREKELASYGRLTQTATVALRTK